MTNAVPRSGLKIRLRATSAALTLVVVLGLEIVAAHAEQAQTFTVLYNFTGSSDGGYPDGGLVRDAAGNLYGTTQYGGASNMGTVFKVDARGIETVLHSFTGDADGAYPYAKLVRDSAGTLYGTTHWGGSFTYGTVFKVDARGTETVLHSFAGGGTDGCLPYGGLLRDKLGNLYGTTWGCGSSTYGTVYKLNKKGTLTLLHSFTFADGAQPYFLTLLMDKKGSLYGTALQGGTSGVGVVFKLDTAGKLTLLHSFNPTTDGCTPTGDLVRDRAGNFYSTTWGCGSSGQFGTVFEVDKKGRETVLYNFTGTTDGKNPYAGLAGDSAGNLYGVASLGGVGSDGTVFQLDTAGKLTVLHSFTGPDGWLPVGDLIRDAKGNLYGTTQNGGTSGYGTVWKIKE